MDPNAPRPAADETLARYMQRTASQHAADHDQLYAAQLHWTRMALRLADQAMEHEGIPEETRRRVTSAMVFGSFDEEDAARRIEDRAAHVRELERLQEQIVVTPEFLTGLGIKAAP